MRSTNRRQRAFVGVMAVLALVVGACGGGSDESESQGQTTSSESSSDSSSESSSESGSESSTESAEPVELVVWFAEAIPDLALVVDEMMAAYTADHPNVTIKTEIIPWSGLDEKVAAAVAAGTEPDIMYTGNVRVPPLAARGVLHELTDQVNAAGDALDFPDAAWPNAGPTVDGKLYALPWEGFPFMLFYNKALFTQAGLDPENPPTTWEEWMAAAKAIDELGPDIAGYAMHGEAQHLGFLDFPVVLWQAGGEILDETNSKPMFNEAAGVEALQFMVDMSEYAQDGFAGYALNDARDVFKQGKAGMVIDGTWSLTGLPNDYPDLDFGVTQVPGHTREATLGGTGSVIMFESCEHQDVAFDLMQFLTTGDAGATWAEGVGFLPWSASAQAAIPRLSDDPLWAAATSMMPTTRVPPMTPAYAELRPELGQAVLLALLGDKTPEQALNDFVPDAQAIIDANG